MATRRDSRKGGQPPGRGKGLQNPFNRGKKNNDGGGRLRASRNAVRQELLREGRQKGVFDQEVTLVQQQREDNWGAMFEFDPDLVAAFDKNRRFFQHMFSVDNILAPLPAPFRKSLSHNFGLFTRVFTQFVDRREQRNMRASIPGLAQLQELADQTEVERLQELREKQMKALQEAEGSQGKRKVTELK